MLIHIIPDRTALSSAAEKNGSFVAVYPVRVCGNFPWFTISYGEKVRFTHYTIMLGVYLHLAFNFKAFRLPLYRGSTGRRQRNGNRARGEEYWPE